MFQCEILNILFLYEDQDIDRFSNISLIFLKKSLVFLIKICLHNIFLIHFPDSKQLCQMEENVKILWVQQSVFRRLMRPLVKVKQIDMELKSETCYILRTFYWSLLFSRNVYGVAFLYPLRFSDLFRGYRKVPFKFQTLNFPESQACKCIIKKLQHRCFPVNIAKCLRIAFFIIDL